MQMTKYDPADAEHMRIAKLLDVDSQIDGSRETTEVYLIKTDDGLDAFTYRQPNGMWFVHAIDFEEDVPTEAETKEEACRLIASLN